MAATDLAAFAAERGVKHVLVSFTDLFGVQRAKLVPAGALAAAQRDGVAFAGVATWLDLTPSHADLLVVPDPASAVQLPWKRDLAWVACDLTLDGVPLAQGPRATLKRLVERAAAAGLTVRTGVEAEFFLLARDELRVADASGRATKPCYDQAGLMRSYDVVGALCDAMGELGWEPRGGGHEDARGQFEINWTFADALRTADRHAFFKFMVKSLAEAHGLRATFMPKPFRDGPGNGCHVHVSAWRENGTNAFAAHEADGADGADGLSATGRHALGGILRHARAMAAITNPTVNSYKRLGTPGAGSGGGVPATIAWSTGRTEMLRVPAPGRLELRFPDGAANPYLLGAAVIAAVLDGLGTQADPGAPQRGDTEATAPGSRPLPQLPQNLLDALRIYHGSEVLKAAIGAEVSAAFLKLRNADWSAFMQSVTPWEIEATLDV